MPPAAENIIEPGGEGDYADVEVGSDILDLDEMEERENDSTE